MQNVRSVCAILNNFRVSRQISVEVPSMKR